MADFCLVPSEYALSDSVPSDTRAISLTLSLNHRIIEGLCTRAIPIGP